MSNTIKTAAPKGLGVVGDYPVYAVRKGKFQPKWTPISKVAPGDLVLTLDRQNRRRYVRVKRVLRQGNIPLYLYEIPLVSGTAHIVAAENPGWWGTYPHEKGDGAVSLEGIYIHSGLTPYEARKPLKKRGEVFALELEESDPSRGIMGNPILLASL